MRSDRYEYEMEDLIPLVAELANRFTSKESSSVTYEKAEYLMEAVLYTLRQAECIPGLKSQGTSPLQEMYRAGYERILEKTQIVQKRYNEMIQDFCAYGNENYRDTVTKAIPGFFRFYDPRLAPQETIITMDYPVLSPLNHLSGIDAIGCYVDAICQEQKFLEKWPEAYVRNVLVCFHSEYRKQFFNLCNIFLRHVLIYLFLEKRGGYSDPENDMQKLYGMIRSMSKEEVKAKLDMILRNMIRNQYENDLDLYHYLEQDIRDFTCRLKIMAESGAESLYL